MSEIRQYLVDVHDGYRSPAMNSLLEFLIANHIDWITGKWKIEWRDDGTGGPLFLLRGKQPNELDYFDSSEFSDLLKQKLLIGHGKIEKMNGSLTIGYFDNEGPFIAGDSEKLEAISKEYTESVFKWETDILTGSPFPDSLKVKR